MIKIDGSQESGSGTIVRDAVSFSVLLGKDLHINNGGHPILGEFILLLLFSTLAFCRINYHSGFCKAVHCQSKKKDEGNSSKYMDTKKTIP